jgi:hypothetical protein
LRPTRLIDGRRRRWALGLPVLLAGALALVLIAGLPGSGGVLRAVGAAGQGGEPSVQTDDSLPARNVILFGASPAEPGEGSGENETWGIGEAGELGGEAWRILSYGKPGGWSLAPSPKDANGQSLQEFRPDSASPMTGEMTPTGAGVLIGTAAPEHQGQVRPQVVLVRGAEEEGGVFHETKPIPAALLKPEGEAAQELFLSGPRAPLIAALAEGSHTGVLAVPVSSQGSATETGVLHWDGNAQEWTREAIEVPGGAQEGFHVLAIGASSPGNAWLLAQISSSSNAVALFRRRIGQRGEPPTWQPVAPAPGAEPGGPLTIPRSGQPGAQFVVPGAPERVRAQTLTVTSEGVWIDGERSEGSASTTMFFKPEGEHDSGEVTASWCAVECTHTLPLLATEGLPSGPSRSFAWAEGGSSAPFGQRVITGLAEGVTLRLEGSQFKRVVSLGGSEPPNDVGGTLGAAFSGPREGWLGNGTYPVHLTGEPAPDRLQAYPVPFHDALSAIAPQPEAPVGALTSEALAVGDQGEVARFDPGEGWLPESLLSASGRPEHPRLRAVAWPTPNRAYAAGEGGESAPMWLWRGETKLWEPDPATPLNFEGTILGIAFEPGNPSRGYAVGEPAVAGQPGVLLRYGKTWTQEALPPEVAGATFTSVAFAGSEAIVAYRIAHINPGEVNGSNGQYTGGLLVNEGSGWHVDQGAAEAIGANGYPWAVAGLPDGGAAVSALSGSGEALVLERNSGGASWQATTAPYPAGEPASLALFREGGALRVIGAGNSSETRNIDFQIPPPAGNPGNALEAYPLELQEGADPVLRQTATGWRDEEHGFNSAQDPLGEYKAYDEVEQPEPIAAVLVGPTGEAGWAVGGVVDPTDPTGAHDTAEVARYPAEANVTPPGEGTYSLAVPEKEATFAIGGNAQCDAPCAERENAGIGPDVWLSSALQRAAAPGVRAFFYTGPRLTTGLGHGTVQVPYPREFERYASLIGSSTIPAFVAASATDREGNPEEGNSRSACGFTEFLSQSFRETERDKAPQGSSLQEIGPSAETSCAAGSEPGYYALSSQGASGNVRVIVLEDASQVGPTQLEWLRKELEEAAAIREPAIAIGNANLGAEAASNTSAKETVERLVAGGASAYFYDAPEENVSGKLTYENPETHEVRSIPAFGSGTLGYIVKSPEERNFKSHSGFLFAHVPAPTGASNVVSVTAQLIPDIGELSLEAKGGTLLRRSSASLFVGLARRPRAGGTSPREQRENRSFDYIPIRANTCIEVACENDIYPEFTFTSSDTELGRFVKPNPAASSEESANAVLLEHEEPVEDPHSGLFCALNPGKVTVTLDAGGLSASLNVTIEPGSVRRPCGTTPLHAPAATQQAAVPAPPPPPAPAPAPAPAPSAVLPLPPPPPVPAVPPAPTRATPPPPPPPPFLALAPPIAPLPAFVPLPVPSPARPTPPSGTSAVTSPIEVAEHQEESEEATESVSNQALAYRAPDHEPSPAYVLGIVLLAAFAGASARRRPRRGRREVTVAPATLTTMRAQRRMERERRRPW